MTDRAPWTRARLAALVAADPRELRLAHLVAVLEGLGRLEAQGKPSASSLLLGAVCGPLPLRLCRVLELGAGLSLVTGARAPSGAVLWSLTDEGRALVLEPKR